MRDLIPLRPQQQPEHTFKVASYNIHRCVGVDRRLNPRRIAQVIKEIDADVIGLQEIDSRFHRKGGHDQIEYLAEATGLNIVAGPTLLRGDGRYGNALLTSHPIHEVRRIDLSFKRREPRGAIDVDLEVNGRTVRVIVAHLGLGMAERRCQVRRLREIFCAEKNHLEVMLGDFNEWMPRGKPLCWIHDYFGKSPGRLTFPSFFPLLALDRIWVRPLDALQHVCTHVTPLSRVASDHLPIKASIALSNGVGDRPTCECDGVCEGGMDIHPA